MLRELTAPRELAPPKDPERILKHRQKTHCAMRIVVCDHNGRAWYEDKPDIHTWHIVDLVRYLRDHWPAARDGGRRNVPIILVCENVQRVFLTLHEAYSHDPEWNLCAIEHDGELFHLDGTVRKPKVKTSRHTKFKFFGFRDKHRHTFYFYPVSPHDFLKDFSKYKPEWSDPIPRLYHWAGTVRKWVRENGLRWSISKGGLAAQLLRDERFYGEPRRKVPTLTNEKARKALPGNFYLLSHPREEGKHYRAVLIIDQENAHHYAAQTVTLPDANTLFARGRFLTTSDECFARNGSDKFAELLDHYGLFRVRAIVPKYLQGLLPPWANRRGPQDFYVYSNEFDLLQELHIDVRFISHAWTSPDMDTGLYKYAAWAEREVEQSPERKVWLKPVLLSAYGILGARPRHLAMAYWRAENGEPTHYFVGPKRVTLQRKVTKRKIQAPIANVIQRGMIEAETRKLSIQLARKLHSEKHHVIGIHSDAVHVVDEGQQLPILPPPWRVKERLRMFHVLDEVSWESPSRYCLPGRSRPRAT